MHYRWQPRWQPRQCMAGTYCLSLSLHLAGQNFLFKMLAAAIAGIAGPCNSSTSAPRALIFPGLQMRQRPSQSVWRLVQFVHTPLEFTGCILLLAAALHFIQAAVWAWFFTHSQIFSDMSKIRSVCFSIPCGATTEICRSQPARWCSGRIISWNGLMSSRVS